MAQAKTTATKSEINKYSCYEDLKWIAKCLFYVGT